MSHEVFGITRYELLKLCLIGAALVAVLVFSTMSYVRIGEVAIENARIAQMQADEAAARAAFNERMIEYTRGQQRGLEDRVDKVEADAKKPVVVPKVVVVVAATPGPTKPPKPPPTPNHPRGGLGGLLLHKGDRK